MNETLAVDGVVHLAGALDAAAMARIEDAFAFSVANPSPAAVRFYPDEDATFFEDTGQHHLDMVRTTGIDDIVRDLWGGVDDIWYLGEQLFLKEGGSSRRTPWHQDSLSAEGEASPPSAIETGEGSSSRRTASRLHSC